MSKQPFSVPGDWEELHIEIFEGTVPVIGAPDVGKSTLARYLFRRLCQAGVKVGYLDGDPGQTTLGPPTTMSLVLSEGAACDFPPPGQIFRTFAGSTSPRGHMLPMLVGSWRLAQLGKQAGARVIIHDTSGLVDPAQGGLALKSAKIDLMRPATIIALQRSNELEALLKPLRRRRGLNLIELRAPSHAIYRNTTQRQMHRTSIFNRYFSNAATFVVRWPEYPVFPGPQFMPHRLIAFEDGEGLASGLGIIIACDRFDYTITVLSPVESFREVEAIRLGSILVDPYTFQDKRLAGP